MNPVSGPSPSSISSQLPQKLEDLKQKYNDLSPEEQNSVQNAALDARKNRVETRTENQQQLRSAAVGVYSNQMAKNNAELFISLSTGVETEIGASTPPSAASNVYKSVQESTIVNRERPRFDLSDMEEKPEQLPQPEPAGNEGASASNGNKPETIDAFV